MISTHVFGNEGIRVDEFRILAINATANLNDPDVNLKSKKN